MSLLNQSFKIDVTLYISGKILFFKFDMEAESETSLLVNEDATSVSIFRHVINARKMM